VHQHDPAFIPAIGENFGDGFSSSIIKGEIGGAVEIRRGGQAQKNGIGSFDDCLQIIGKMQGFSQCFADNIYQAGLIHILFNELGPATGKSLDLISVNIMCIYIMPILRAHRSVHQPHITSTNGNYLH